MNDFRIKSSTRDIPIYTLTILVINQTSIDITYSILSALNFTIKGYAVDLIFLVEEDTDTSYEMLSENIRVYNYTQSQLVNQDRTRFDKVIVFNRGYRTNEILKQLTFSNLEHVYTDNIDKEIKRVLIDMTKLDNGYVLKDDMKFFSMTYSYIDIVKRAKEIQSDIEIAERLTETHTLNPKFRRYNKLMNYIGRSYEDGRVPSIDMFRVKGDICLYPEHGKSFAKIYKPSEVEKAYKDFTSRWKSTVYAYEVVKEYKYDVHNLILILELLKELKNLSIKTTYKQGV